MLDGRTTIYNTVKDGQHREIFSIKELFIQNGLLTTIISLIDDRNNIHAIFHVNNRVVKVYFSIKNFDYKNCDVVVFCSIYQEVATITEVKILSWVETKFTHIIRHPESLTDFLNSPILDIHSDYESNQS
jgi:hypothetical protein